MGILQSLTGPTYGDSQTRQKLAYGDMNINPNNLGYYMVPQDTKGGVCLEIGANIFVNSNYPYYVENFSDRDWETP